MRKLWVVAAREYSAAVKTKAFIIGLLFMPIMMGGSVLVQLLVKDIKDVKDKHFAVIDRTGELYDRLNQAAETKHPGFVLHQEKPSAPDPKAIREQRFQLSERVRKGELFGFLDIGPEVLKAKKIALNPHEGPQWDAGDLSLVRYHTNRSTFMDFSRFAGIEISGIALEKRAKALNVPEDAVKEAAQAIPVASKGLLKRDPTSGEIEDARAASPMAAFLIPFMLIMLMFMTIMTGATPLMQGVVEEKMQRIAEVLLGSVPPFQLMLGKLLGMTAVSLTIGAVYLTGAYWAAHHYGYAEYASPSLLAWFLVFQTLAALMYGALFIAIGAACSDMKETQSLLLPVMLLACLPMFVMTNVIQEPNGPIATGLSFFPFATPMLMIARQAIPPGLPWWQPFAGMLVVLAATIVCVYVAARIFRVGILMQGKGAKLGEMLRWVLRG